MTEIPSVQKLPNLRTSISQFFYAEEVPYGLAIARILVPLVLLVPTLPRWFRVRELYSADGAPIPLAQGYGFPDLLPELPGSVAIALYTALVFFLFTSCLGWRTRLSLIASTVLYTYFNMLDSASTMTKYSVVGTHALLILTLSGCGTIWSIDSWLAGTWRLKSSPGEPSIALPRTAVWPRRLMQIMLGVMYLGAAMTKFHTPEYFSGDQLMFWMITELNYYHGFGEYLTMFPALLVVMSYATVIWEILFVFTAWRGWGRIVMLSVGIAFHVMTGLTLGLTVFPMVCLACYFAFLEESDVRGLATYWAGAKQRYLPVRMHLSFAWLPSASLPSPQRLRRPLSIVFGFALPILMIAAVEAEHLADPYGIRRPEGPYELRQLTEAEVEQAMDREQPTRTKDAFFALDVGSITLGGMLLDRRRVFAQGDKVLAQCVLNPPHKDMWVECNLHDSQDRVLNRAGQVLVREVRRGLYYYNLSETLNPGDYYLVLTSGGEEVLRKKIEIVPSEKAPVAN